MLFGVLWAAGGAHAQVGALARASSTAGNSGRPQYHYSPRTQPGSGWNTRPQISPRTQPGSGWNNGASAFNFGRGTVYPSPQGTNGSGQPSGGYPLRSSHSAPGSGWNSASTFNNNNWYYPGSSSSGGYTGGTSSGSYTGGSTYGTPLPQSNHQPVRQVVLLENPSSTGTTVHYRIAGNEYQMPPGYRQTISGTAAWVIDFHRGGPYGRKQYTLHGGTYHFTPTQQGWDLRTQQFKVTLDNSENLGAFQYVVNNERAVVGAAATRTHTSGYPIVIRFDRGNGSAVKQVEVGNGTVKVAFNPADNLWDLFRARQPAGLVSAY